MTFEKNRIMRLKMYIVPVFFVSIVFLLNFSSLPPSGPCDSPFVGGHTGAPGETSCTGCHGGTANTGPGSLILTVNDTTLKYIPGEVFDATVIIQQLGRDKFGFVGLALKDSDNTTVGAFTIDDMVRTRTFNDGPRDYVAHTPCGADAMPPDSLSWTFHWQAPSTNVGEITLYLAGLAANHSHSLGGDDTYTLSIRLVPDSMVSKLDDISAPGNLILWPNPVSDVIHFAFKNHSDSQLVNLAEVWSVDGHLIYTITEPLDQLLVAALVPGMYLLRLRNKKGDLLSQTSFVKN